MNKLFSKIATLSVGLTMAIGVGVAVGSKEARVVKAETYTLITSNSSLSNGDSVVLATKADDAPKTGVTGFNGTKDATVSTTESSWKKYTVGSASSSGWTLYDEDAEQYIASPTANEFKYADSGGTCSVTSAGVISCNTRELAINGTAYRFYGSTSTYERFYVWKVSGGSTTTYTISYGANGGTGTMSDSVGSNPSVAACTFTAPNGKVFSKWNTAANGSGTDYAAGDKPGKDLSLYAIWAVSESILIEASSTDQLSVSPWSVDNTPSQCETTNLSRGWQWSGGTSAVITYTSSQAFKKVVVGASTNGASTSLAVAVGGVAFGDSQSVTSGTAAARTDYTFEGTGEGNVVITLTNTASKSAYINKIELFFDDGPDPSKDTLVVKLNDATLSPQTLTYSSTASWLFYANDKDDNDINSEWESSDPSIFSVTKNGNNVAVVTPHKGGTATLTASHEDYNSGSFVLTIDVGTLQSLSLTGDMSNKTYTAGESWNPTGLVVSGTYSSGYVGPVSESVEWTYSPENAAYGTTSVSVTATVGGKSASKTVTGITINTVETTPIADFFNGKVTLATSGSSSAWFYVKGVVVAVNGYQYYIQEGEYGLLIYGNDTDHPAWYSGIAVGDYVLLHTKVYKYVASGDTAGGLVETYNKEKAQTVQKLGTAALPDAAEYTTVASFMSAHQSTRASLSNVAVDADNIKTISGFSGTTDSDQKFNVYDVNSSSNTVTVIVYKSLSEEDKTAIVTKLKTITKDDTIEFVRGVVAYYKGNQISLASADQIIIHTPSEDKLAAWGVNRLFIGNPAFDGDGTGACKTANYYVDAKTALLALDDEESGSIAKLQSDDTYEDELARYLAWAKACGDNSPFEDDFTFMNAALNTFGAEANSTMIIIIVIASISVLAFTTLLVFKKKKHN